MERWFNTAQLPPSRAEIKHCSDQQLTACNRMFRLHMFQLVVAETIATGDKNHGAIRFMNSASWNAPESIRREGS